MASALAGAIGCRSVSMPKITVPSHGERQPGVGVNTQPSSAV